MGTMGNGNLDNWSWALSKTNEWYFSCKQEHSFVKKVRKGILAYRMKSMAHHALDIMVDAGEVIQHQERWITSKFKIKILLSTWGSDPIPLICRPRFAKGNFTGDIQVKHKRQWLPLDQVLSHHFPHAQAYITTDDMRRWWSCNGKSFKWAGLPTEIKEHIVQYCMREPVGYDDYFHGLHQCRYRLKENRPRGRKSLVYEVVNRLGPWSSLLFVSMQVRAITLRLCFTGSIIFPSGLCGTFHSPYGLDHAIHRLGKYFQITQPNSVPEPNELPLAKLYATYPTQHPHLSRFATYRHAIRKLCLKWGFLAYLQFFNVDVGGFQQAYRAPNYRTCEVLEQLSSLDSVVLFLPWGHAKLKEVDPHVGPRLFHPDDPCPRLLHRIIYERAADVLAPYHVHMSNFGDAGEEARFGELRAAAVMALGRKQSRLHDLYDECGGGIQLDDTQMDGVHVQGNTTRQLLVDDLPGFEGIQDEGKNNHIFPPRCECEIPCRYAFTGI